MNDQPENYMLQLEEQREDALREARLRRLARKYGLELRKSRYRWDAGSYQLRDPRTNFIVLGGGQWGFGLSLDDVDQFLSADEDAAIKRAPEQLEPDRRAFRGHQFACYRIKTQA